MAAVTLTPGANTALPSGGAVTVAIGWDPKALPGMEVDASAFLIGSGGTVPDDAHFVFYGAPASPNGAVRFDPAPPPGPGTGAGDIQAFTIALDGVPAAVEAIDLCLTIHEGQARRQSFASLRSVFARVLAGGNEVARFDLPTQGMGETAITLAKVYRRAGQWKLRAVGQGFAGGLAPLARQYGVDVAEEAPPSAPPPAPPPPAPSRVRLDKKLVDLEKKDPQLVSLVKAVQVSLEKKALASDRAKVCLCLDISGSMHGLYRSGKIDALVQRIMALGYRFDDDGEIDVFLFGTDAHEHGAAGVATYRSLVADILRRHPLEGGTNYGKAMDLIRAFYRRTNPDRQPVYVMFVTDGNTQDQALTERQLQEASAEPLFWQFMAIGRKPAERKGFFGRLLGSDFTFLEKLDDLPGRVVDNANFFLVGDPGEPADETLFDLLMAEYPAWLTAAAAKGIVRI